MCSFKAQNAGICSIASPRINQKAPECPANGEPEPSKWPSLPISLCAAQSIATPAKTTGKRVHRSASSAPRAQRKLACSLSFLLGQGNCFHHENHTLISGGTTNIKGELRAAGSASFGQRYMARYINEFLRAYPDRHVRLELSDGILDVVEQGFSTGTDAVAGFIVDRLAHHTATQAFDKDVALPVHCALADLGGSEGL